MRFNPRGAAVGRLRLRHVETLDTGAEVTLTLTGPGAVFRVRGDSPKPGEKPADMRRGFVRAARAIGVWLVPVEFAQGTFDQRGKPVSDPVPSAYQGIGAD